MNRRPLVVAGIAACALALAACDDKSAAPAAPAGAQPQTTTTAKGAPPKAGEVKDVQVRFVLLIDGPAKAPFKVETPKSSLTNGTGGGQKTTTTASDPDTRDTDTKTTEPKEPADKGLTMLADIKGGEASEYLTVKSGSTLVSGDTKLIEIPATKAGERQTIALGTAADGKLEAAGFIERDGKVTGEFGVTKPQGTPAPSKDKATIFGSAIGAAKAAKDKPLKLGTAKGCLGGKPVTDTQHSPNNVEAGDAELAWYTDDGCKKATGASKSVTLKEGQQGYAFAWQPATEAEPQVVFLPVEAGDSASDSTKEPKEPKETKEPTEPSEPTEPADEATTKATETPEN